MSAHGVGTGLLSLADGYRAERDAALAEVARLRRVVELFVAADEVVCTGPQGFEIGGCLRRMARLAALSPDGSAPATGDRA